MEADVNSNRGGGLQVAPAANIGADICGEPTAEGG